MPQPQRDRRQHLRTRVLWPVVVVVGFWLSAAQPAWATSPTGTLEVFFARTNTVLQSVDPAHGLRAPRQAIRDLVNEAFDFRAAAAVALGSVWLWRVPEDQAADPEIQARWHQARRAIWRGTFAPRPGHRQGCTPGDTQRPVGVVGRLVVRSRSGAERDVAALLARAGGTTLSRQRGPTITVVKGVVPHSSYKNFAAGLRGIGSWQLEAERSPLSNLLHVTVRLAE